MCPVVHVASPLSDRRLAVRGEEEISHPRTAVTLFVDHPRIYRLRFDKRAIFNPLPVAKLLWAATPPLPPIPFLCIAFIVRAQTIESSDLAGERAPLCPSSRRLMLNSKNVQQSATVLKIRIRWDEEHEQQDSHCFFSPRYLICMWFLCCGWSFNSVMRLTFVERLNNIKPGNAAVS